MKLSIKKSLIYVSQFTTIYSLFFQATVMAQPFRSGTVAHNEAAESLPAVCRIDHVSDYSYRDSDNDLPGAMGGWDEIPTTSDHEFPSHEIDKDDDGNRYEEDADEFEIED